MPDREKVIMALEKEIATAEAIEAIAGGFVYLTKGEVRDALELLKGQEPVEAKVMGKSKSHGSWWFACGACGHAIDPEDNFCRECGMKVKWE